MKLHGSKKTIHCVVYMRIIAIGRILPKECGIRNLIMCTKKNPQHVLVVDCSRFTHHHHHQDSDDHGHSHSHSHSHGYCGKDKL